MNEEARRQVAETGETPLAYMLRVMRDGRADKRRRDDMAKAAARYCHAALASVEHMGKGGGPIEFTDVRDRLAHILAREAASDNAAEDTPTAH